MTLRVVGAGVGRTGTTSLKLALEQLLGAPCYHMTELFSHPEHVRVWHAAARDEPVGRETWESLFDGYAAAVDWPASAFWAELSDAFPDALVLLSTRDPEGWWESADATIFPTLRSPRREGPPLLESWGEMVEDMMSRRFTAALDDRDAAIAAYERHNAAVRQGVPPERLLEWRVGDGWAPLCEALGLPVPDAPFPRANSREDFAQTVRTLGERAQAAAKPPSSS